VQTLKDLAGIHEFNYGTVRMKFADVNQKQLEDTLAQAIKQGSIIQTSPEWFKVVAKQEITA